MTGSSASSQQTSPSTSSTAAGADSTALPTTAIDLPSPFDSTMGNNFTSPDCPAFFQSFLTNDTFRQCLPLSLLLQTSAGFFAASRSPVLLARTLDATCHVDPLLCTPLMATLAASLQQDANCGADLAMGNPTVLQAYNGLTAYQPVYQAGCLTDADGRYCFANAIANTTAGGSSYVYYLPLGVPLPAGTVPACDACLQNTMAIFAAAAGNRSSSLNDDYTAAAQQVDASCGPEFVEASVEMKSAGSAGAMMGPGVWALGVGLLLCGLLA
ncbi:hypothetical protein LTR53_012017 [Teratosphaeriaceae sp. CCFEE 6253]|nr:hypothetical protein LTR53_012017 [Teratosphaeriaceae sp. CCFEE 6253]